MSKAKRVLRVAVGTPDELFAPVWRFWTHRDSGYFSQRIMGGLFKCSYHPTRGAHKTAIWTAAFTRESGQTVETTGSRRAKTWPQAAPFMEGWYRGPSISIPRLADRPYDFPQPGPAGNELAKVVWVEPPGRGREIFLTVFLTDGRDDLSPFPLGDRDRPLAELPMDDGWLFSIVTTERALPLIEQPVLKKLRDEQRWGLNAPPVRGDISGAVLWVTTSPEGPPLFVQIVLGSDNFYDNTSSATPA